MKVCILCSRATIPQGSSAFTCRVCKVFFAKSIVLFSKLKKPRDRAYAMIDTLNFFDNKIATKGAKDSIVSWDIIRGIVNHGKK